MSTVSFSVAEDSNDSLDAEEVAQIKVLWLSTATSYCFMMMVCVTVRLSYVPCESTSVTCRLATMSCCPCLVSMRAVLKILRLYWRTS